MLLSIDIDIVPSVRLVGHVNYKNPWIHFSRTIDEYILYIIKNGELHIQEGDLKYILKKGDLLLLQPNIMHIGLKESCCDYYYVHFKHPRIEPIPHTQCAEKINEMILKRKLSLTSNFLQETSPTDSICYMPKYYHFADENEFIYLLNGAIDDFYKRYENYKKLISCKFLDLLIRVCREYISKEIESLETHFPRAFIKARNISNYLNSKYHEKITGKTIEEIFNSDYDYLNRVFHKMTGYSIFNYLNMVRINKARELIGTTPKNFSEIGYLVGIDDPYYFSRLFKKYSGMTPTQYLVKKNNDL